ncbi:MAG: hypothetical protein AAGD25_04310 [Cyanobacteria bacterium P01_F01_bin.150]
MNLPVIFNVAIGLVLIYLVLSLIASEIQEMLATVLEWRAKHLKESIAYLLSAHASQTSDVSDNGNSSEVDEGRMRTLNDADSFVELLYSNPLIVALNHSARNRIQSKGPSYIESKTFALALLDTVHRLPDNVLTATLDDIWSSIAKANIPGNLKDNLRILVQQARTKANRAEEEVQKFQEEIAAWFDQSMDRASGVYKRNAKGIALILGVAIAVGANVDSLHIINVLSQDRMLQDAMHQIAEQIVVPQASDLDCVKDSMDSEAKVQCLSLVQRDMSLAIDRLDQFPIGWHLDAPAQQVARLTPLKVLKTTVGWMISGVAISMGAPFWFSLLNQTLSLRATGKKP